MQFSGSVALLSAIRLLLGLSLAFILQDSARAQRASPSTPKLVQKLRVDWDYSGKPTVFSLFYQDRNGGDGVADSIQISREGLKPWILVNRYDEWEKIAPSPGPIIRRAHGQINTDESFFISTGHEKSPVYLFLRGVGYGCCVGSLTILMAGASSPKILFSAEEFLIESVLPLENGNGVQFVGKSSLSEARATKNAESYDPYQVFHIDGAANATYDLQLSKVYSTDHYCEWAGSKYNENLVAVGKPVSSSTCHVMTEERFTDYLHRHPGEFK